MTRALGLEGTARPGSFVLMGSGHCLVHAGQIRAQPDPREAGDQVVCSLPVPPPGLGVSYVQRRF